MMSDNNLNYFDPLRDLRNLVTTLRVSNGYTEAEILEAVHKSFDRYELTSPTEVMIARMRTRLLMERIPPHNVESILSFVASWEED